MFEIKGQVIDFSKHFYIYKLSNFKIIGVAPKTDGRFSVFMRNTMTDQVWYQILKDVYEFEAKCSQDYLGVQHVDIPAILTLFNTDKIADYYWHQALLFQSREAKTIRGPFTLFMSKYFDGLAWFELLLHINQQADVCASLCGKKAVGESG